MFLFRWPASLWFLGGGGTTATSVDICVSVVYKASIGVDVLDSVDINLSALAFVASVDLGDDPDPREAIQAAIDLDDDNYSSIDLKASVTPVFVIEQSGMIERNVSRDLTASASITASVFVNASVSVTYKASASIVAQVSVISSASTPAFSTNYQISASIGVLLLVQIGTDTKDIITVYNISASITPQVVVVNQGGLVWSRSKQKYIAVRVGAFTSA